MERAARGSRPAGRPSRAAQRAASGSRAERRLVGLLEVVAVLERPHQHGGLAGEQAVDDERRRVLHEHAALAELPRHVPRGRKRHVVGRRRAHDLDQRQHRDGVEEVEADDALGMLETAAIAVTESDDVFVTSRHSGETTFSSAANTSRLTRAPRTRPRGRGRSPRTPPCRPRLDDRAEEPGLALRETAPRDLPRELAADRVDRLLGAAGSTSVSTTGTSSRRRNSVASWVAIRPAPTTRPAGSAAAGVRDAGRPLDPPLDDVERVDRGLGLRAGEQLGERVLLRGVALVERPRGRALDQLERAVRGGRQPVDDVVDARACLAHDVRYVAQIGLEPRLPSPASTAGGAARSTRRGTRPARARGRRARARVPPRHRSAGSA